MYARLYRFLFAVWATLMLAIGSTEGSAVMAQGQQGLPAGYRSLSCCPYVIEADSLPEALELSDSLFNALAIGVQFKVNRTDIDPKSEFFRIYNDQILPLLFGRHLRLSKLFIRGAASPEGPYDNNRRLGQGRSAALLNMIGQDMQQAYGEGQSLKMDSHIVTEDYGYLIDLMREADDADWQRVAEIFENANHDERETKRQLQQVDGKRLWNRLLQEYFPRLRAARIVLVVTRIPEKEPIFCDICRFESPLDRDHEWLPVYNPQPLVMPVFNYSRRHLIALRTNLLHDGFYMPQFGWAFSPNAQLEYYPLDGHYTYNVGLTWGTNRKWDSQEFWQVRDVQLEVRRYFRGGGDFTGLYAGAYAQGSKYGIGLSDTKGWEGEGGGAGLSLGYVMPLNKRGNLRLEFMAALGYYRTYYDPYVYGNPITGTIDGDYYYDYLGNAESFKKRNHVFSWLGPTNLGIQLTYDIIYRKRHLTN